MTTQAERIESLEREVLILQAQVSLLLQQVALRPLAPYPTPSIVPASYVTPPWRGCSICGLQECSGHFTYCDTAGVARGGA